MAPFSCKKNYAMKKKIKLIGLKVSSFTTDFDNMSAIKGGGSNFTCTHTGNPSDGFDGCNTTTILIPTDANIGTCGGLYPLQEKPVLIFVKSLPDKNQLTEGNASKQNHLCQLYTPSFLLNSENTICY